jgi:hypothetical protein
MQKIKNINTLHVLAAPKKVATHVYKRRARYAIVIGAIAGAAIANSHNADQTVEVI